MKPDPIGLPRNPFHVFLFVVAFVNGIPLAFGVPSSNAIDKSLPLLGIEAYGIMLMLGAGSVLAGMYWQGDPRTGLLIKRFGYLALSFATFIYACAVIFVNHAVGGALAGSVTVCFSMICFWQYRVLNHHVSWAISHDQSGLIE